MRLESVTKLSMVVRRRSLSSAGSPSRGELVGYGYHELRKCSAIMMEGFTIVKGI